MGSAAPRLLTPDGPRDSCAELWIPTATKSQPAAAPSAQGKRRESWLFDTKSRACAGEGGETKKESSLNYLLEAQGQASTPGWGAPARI